MFESKPRVLVIDDDAQVLRAFSRLLSRHFLVESEAAAAPALRRLAGGESFDVILCDRNLPGGMSGQDFFEAVDPAVQKRIVICSGAPLAPDDAFAAVLGSRFFLKSSDAAGLAALLLRVARRKASAA